MRKGVGSKQKDQDLQQEAVIDLTPTFSSEVFWAKRLGSKKKDQEDGTLTTRGPPLSPWQASLAPSPPKPTFRHFHLQWLQ